MRNDVRFVAKTFQDNPVSQVQGHDAIWQSLPANPYDGQCRQFCVDDSDFNFFESRLPTLFGNFEPENVWVWSLREIAYGHLDVFCLCKYKRLLSSCVATGVFDPRDGAGTTP